MNIVLSIKSKWAAKIYRGEKYIEWRKTKPKKFDISKDVIFLYETDRKFVSGYIKLRDFNLVEDAKKILPGCGYITGGCVPKDSLIKYANGGKLYAWNIEEFFKMSPEYINRFSPNEKPPQSWCYTKAYLCNGTLNFDHRLKINTIII